MGAATGGTTGRGHAPDGRWGGGRSAFWATGAVAAVLLLAPPATAPAGPYGTGVWVADDFSGDSTSTDPTAGAVAASDLLRVGMTEDASDIHFWLKANTLNAPYWGPVGDCASNNPSTGGIGYRAYWQVAGVSYSAILCFDGASVYGIGMYVSTPNTPVGSAGVRSQTAVISGRWVCNELVVDVARIDIGSPPSGAAVTEIYGASGSSSTFWGGANPGIQYDRAPNTTPYGTYTMGSTPPSDAPTGLTATFVTDHIRLNWAPPLGGPDVTGYRIERGPSAVGPWTMLYTSGPTTPPATPPTTYDDYAIVAGTTYYYRVEVLRCQNQALGAYTNVASATAGVVVPPALIASFAVDAVTFSTCMDSRVVFADTSSGPEPIVLRTWDFGDGSPPETLTGAAAAHVFRDTLPHTVTLTVTDAVGGTDDVAIPVSSIGDPDCCPELSFVENVLATEGETVSLRLHATDFEGAPIAYGVTGTNLPAHAMDPATGRFTWATEAGSAGLYTLRATASDGGCTDAQSFTVTVRAVRVSQVDDDEDGRGGASDNCPSVPNWDQADADHDGLGDACDAAPCGEGGQAEGCDAAGMPAPRPATPTERDADRDGVPDVQDSCPAVANHAQADLDGDATGDACDIDIDGDGVVNGHDNCPLDANWDQRDGDADGVGDVCSGQLALGAQAQAARLPSAPEAPAAGAAPNVASQMPKMGMAAIAFAAVVLLGIVVAMRLKR